VEYAYNYPKIHNSTNFLPPISLYDNIAPPASCVENEYLLKAVPYKLSVLIGSDTD
jgi:hypothetical protein